MELRKLLKRQERTVCFEFVPGFEVKVRYMPLPDRVRVMEGGNSRNVIKDGKVQSQGLNKAVESLTAGMIVDWQLPAAVAVRLLEIDPAGLAGVETIPCTEDNKLLLIQEVSGFGMAVNNVASVLENFRAEELQAEVENLSQS